MSVDRHLEQIYGRVTLVGGVGDPSRGRLCIMSFVALLAGEGHSDMPATASRVIRNFAVPVNDAMPAKQRQRLKPFAPRIIGTHDGLDGRRAAWLRQVLAQEILPRMREDARIAVLTGSRRRLLERFWAPSARWHLEGRMTELLRAFDNDLLPDREAHVGAALGRMLVLCAAAAPSPERQAWYWDRAIALLDELCEIGAERRAAVLTPFGLQRADAVLPASGPADHAGWAKWFHPMSYVSSHTSEDVH